MKTRTQRIQDQDEGQKKNNKKIINQKDIKEDSKNTQEVKGSKKIKTQNPIPTKNKTKNQNKPIRITNDEPNDKEQKKDEEILKKLQSIQPKRKRASSKDDHKKVDNNEQQNKESAKEKKDENKDDKKGGNNKQEAKQQVKTFQFKGKVPIDEYCPLKNANHHVLEYQGKVYSATLNQSNVVHNNNKFYILQIIQHDNNPNQCYLFTRWGRVGVQGQKDHIGPSPMNMVIKWYNKKYHQKHNKGDYRQIELNYEVQEQKKKQNGPQKNKDTKQEVFNKSKLPLQVKRLIELIFDINMMNKHMIQIGYDVSRMPLGKLSKDNIMKGYKILQELINEIKGKDNRKKIQQFSNEFYSFIPHDIGFARMGNFILDNEQKVKKKIEMLEALAEIKVATNLIGDAESQNQNIIDSNYAKLKRQIYPVDKETNEFQVINKYLQSTHADTHGSYSLQLQDLFKLKSQIQDIRYTKNVGNKMLLWHGSRLTNFVGILSQGLRIAPPEAPVTGYMFGKGVYFADMSSKSANYCFTNRQNYTGILLLCEVALGDMNQKYQADYYAANLPSGKLSTKGIGRIAPNPQNQVELQKGVAIPMGPGQQTNKMGCSLMYNQFIVYDIAQIKIKYLLITKFNYKKY